MNSQFSKINRFSKVLAEQYSELLYEALDVSNENETDVRPNTIEKCISFLLSQLDADDDYAVSVEMLEGCDDSIDIPSYLELSNLRYRNITLPDSEFVDDFGPILVLYSDANSEELIPCVYFKDEKRNLNYIYDSSANTMSRPSYYFKKGIRFKRFAYQIVASLPPSPQGFIEIAKFSLKAFKADLALLFYASIALAAFNICIPIMTSYLTTTIIPATDLGLLISTSALVVVIIFSASIGQYFQGITLLRLETLADTRLQPAVWSKLLTLPLTFFEKYSPGDLSSRVNSITQIRKQLGSSLISAAISLLFGFTYFVGMLTVNVQLSLAALGYSLLVASFIIFYAKKSADLQEPLLEANAELNNFSLQSVIGFPQVRTSLSSLFILDQIYKRIKSSINLQNKSNFYNDMLELGGSVFTPFATWLILSIVSYYLVAPGQDQDNLDFYVIFISFNAYFAAFILSISTASNTLAVSLTKCIALWRRVEPILYAEPEVGSSPDAHRHTLKGSLQLSDINYSYPDTNRLVIKNLSFDIDANNYTAITGPSGSGKSTIARLILGFDQPRSGSINVDHLPLTALSIRHYRSQIGVVMQNIQINPGSIYDVICGGGTYSRDEVWEALEKSSFSDDVHAMPMQLETLISEGGTNLSGGQRQRLMLATALVSNPKILLLDEATSALDEISQHAVSSTLENLGITRIAIAHRLTTIRNANKIVVLENGCLTQMGTFDELKEESGYLRNSLASK